MTTTADDAGAAAEPGGPAGAGGYRPDLSGPGAADVFGRLFDQYAPGLHRYLAGRVGEAADDMVAETFLAAWTGRSTYDPDRASVRAWLYAIATNQVRRRHRVHLRRRDADTRAVHADVDSLHEHDGRVAERVDAHVLVRQLVGALELVEERDLEVLLLTAWAGLDTTEVAVVLDIPVGTVRSRLHRVRRRLRTNGPARTTGDSDA